MESAQPSHRELARLDLGRRLRKLRTDAGLSGVQLAARLGWSQAKVSRVETGVIAITPGDVEAFASALSEDRELVRSLVALDEELLTDATSWQVLHRHGIAEMQRNVARAEHASRLIREFEATIVPGLLQTAAYMRQVFGEIATGGEPEIAEAVGARLERQAALYDAGRSFVFLMLENVLRLTYGSHRLMQHQIDHIASLSTLEHVTVGVLPFHRPLAALPTHGFKLYDDRLATVETETAQLDVPSKGEIAVYDRMFETLRAQAVTGDEARALLRDLATHHRAAGDRFLGPRSPR